MAKYVVGDRVGEVNGQLKYREYGEPRYGVVTDVLSNGNVMVEWENKYGAPKRKESSPGNLLPEAEIKAKYSELEQAFLKVQAEVEEKLKAASTFILEAEKIASAAGLNLQDMRDATDHLEDAMNEAGWQTSSWHC